MTQSYVPNVSGNTGWNGHSDYYPGLPSAPPGQTTGAPQNGVPNLGQYVGSAPGASPLAGSGVVPGAPPAGGPPAGGLYSFAPNAGGPAGGMGLATNTSPAGNTMVTPTFGAYGQGGTTLTADQQSRQRFGIQNDINYGDYQRQSSNADSAAQYGQNVLNDPNAAAALAAQNKQAGGPSAGQQIAAGYQGGALNLLGNAAAGNGPSAADIQGQKSISDAMHAQLTAAASARGGAYAQAGAQQGAQQQAANIQAQGAGGAAALRAQEQQNAMGQYAGAAGAATTAANAAYVGQANAMGAATNASQAEQGMGLNYYNQLANLYQGQAGEAGTLASNQVANDYGLAGTQLQTTTQQNIANQQQQQQEIGAGVAAFGTIAAAALSTGGAQAAAKGAREHGATEAEAQAIGTHVGQALGMQRAPAAMVHAARPADAAAARKGAMTPDEMHAHMAELRARGKRVPATPGPETEPEAAHAYAAGSHLAALAKMHAAQQSGRAHVARGRP